MMPPMLPPYLRGYSASLLSNNFLSKRWPQKYIGVRHKTYEGEGKTTVRILNKDMESGLLINSYSQVGFRLNNGILVLGPMVIFPRSVLSWNVAGMEDINEKSLSLFYLLEPKIDILVLGMGDTASNNAVKQEIMRMTHSHKINVEILPTEQACATFNFLNAESRLVAAALIPPMLVHITDNDRVKHRMNTQKVYEIDEDKLF